MPHYDYCCKECHHAFEAKQSIKESALRTCPACGQETLERQVGGGGVILQFKGSGFYKTDYCGTTSSSSSAPKGNCGCSKPGCTK